MKKLILKALLTFTVLSMTLSPVFALDEVAPTNGNEITQKQIANISENDLINYVYLEETETINSYENVVLSLKDEYKNASNAILTYTDSSNKSYQVNSSNQNDSEVLFKIENLTEGTYQLSSMTFEMDGNVYQSTFTSDYNASFSVVNGVSTQSLDDCDEEIEEYANDSSMKVVEATSLDEALDAVKSVKARSHNGNYVVYLDAGHDNTHTGARGVNGIKEETYTLAIAQACRDELQQYRNVEVHMCRDDSGSCPYPGTSSAQCNTNRVRDAASKGADLYIALHLNSGTGNHSAHGAEVFVSNHSAYHNEGTNLANQILSQLESLGLKNRGVKVRNTGEANSYYNDGTVKDYYGVIRHGVESGINSMIVEHAFVDNYSDANYITNRYHDIGVADATAIANYLGLSKGPHVTLKGFTWQVHDDRILIGTAYDANTDVRFTFKSYNLGTHQWVTLGENKTSNWQTWVPEKGNYWIYVEATTPDGYTTNQVMCFAVGKNYAPYVSLNGFTWQVFSDRINIGTAYSTNTTGVRFTFKSYNLDTKKWTALSNEKASNWQTWYPKKGNYWIYVEATLPNGYKTNQVMCFAVGKNYSTRAMSARNASPAGTTLSADDGIAAQAAESYYARLKGFTWQMQDDKILLGSAYDTNDSGTQFSFKAYNLDTQKWETLSTFKSSNWQTWKPYKGNYWIYCQAKTSTGYTTDQVMCFAVGKDYGPYVHLNGYTWQMKSDSILVGSAYNTNDSDVKFTYKSYNLTTKQWQSLSDNSSSNWVTWKPERGNYWIYCQAKTSNGYTSDQTMCFAVSEDYSGNLYRIMGSSSITVDQMVKFYENGKGNATYDTFGESQYNGCLTQGGAPDIRTYCQIFKEEAENEGVKVEVAFTQAMLETGYLKFGGDVKPNQYNFAGIGATGNGNPGNSFGDVRTGIRAQIQHLKCYASTDSLNLAKVDPRWNNNLRGKAKYVEYLSIPNNPYGTGWAASATYGKDLLKLITNLYKC